MNLALWLSILSLSCVAICLGLIFYLYKTNRSLSKTLVSQAKSQLEANQIIKGQSEELHEIRSGTYAMLARVKELELQLESFQQTLQSAQQALVEQDPQSRFYSKGVKLISQGASLEDVMRECEMPAAEAELLFNLHNK